MSCFSGIWKKTGDGYEAQELSNETFVLDLEYAPEWSEEGDIIAVSYQSTVEYFHFALYSQGQCLRELEYSADHGWAKAEGKPQRWESSVLILPVAPGASEPFINAQDAALAIIRHYRLPETLPPEAPPSAARRRSKKRGGTPERRGGGPYTGRQHRKIPASAGQGAGAQSRRCHCLREQGDRPLPAGPS